MTELPKVADPASALAAALHPEYFGEDIDSRTAYVQQMWRAGQRRAHEEAAPILAALAEQGWTLVPTAEVGRLRRVEAAARQTNWKTRTKAMDEALAATDTETP